MKLESALKHFSPQGMHISDDVKKHITKSPDRNRCYGGHRYN
ncbi:antitermination protein [Klebsiella pneumoniae]|nr:antitermination protein [Klebsiella pneumoniae]